MPDIFTQFENKLEELYIERREAMERKSRVLDWDDANFRWGGLTMIREVGKIIKDLRNPTGVKENGEIADILNQQQFQNGEGNDGRQFDVT